MRVNGQAHRSLWPGPQRDAVFVIDQRALPHHLRIERLGSVPAVHDAIRDMWVRGAPLIGATAAYGLALQARDDASDAALQAACRHLASARPTAVNLAWALQRMWTQLQPLPRARACRGGVARGRCHCRRGRGHQPGHRPPRPGLAGRVEPPPAKAHPRADALQCRLAGHGGLGHGVGAGVPGAGRRHRRARVGGRDPPAQPGRQPDGLGAGAAGRAAHADRRQRRRPPDAARPGGHRHRRLRPRQRERRCLQQDRHLPEGAGGPRQRRALLCGDAAVHLRCGAAGWAGADPDRGTPRARADAHHRARCPRRRGGGATRPRRHGRGEPGLRCHAGAAGHRPHHRARRRRGATTKRCAGCWSPSHERRRKRAAPAGGGGNAPAGCAGPEPRQHRQPEPSLHAARAGRHADHAHGHGRR